METQNSPKKDLEKKRFLFFQIGLVVALGFVLLAFEWKTYESAASPLGEIHTDEVEEEIIPITMRAPAPPPPPPPKPQVSMKLVENNEKKAVVPKVEEPRPTEITEIPEQPEAPIEEPEFYISAESMPSFIGCEIENTEAQKSTCTYRKIMGFIRDNIDYPDRERDAGIGGTVYLSYIIDEKGEVTNVQILQGIDGGEALEKEAVRVVRSLPKFNPGKQRGKAVPVKYNQPIKFSAH